MFLEDERRLNADELNEVYVVINFRPCITNKNWRMDCGVAGYDNRFGLPPFFPTQLRFEDYIYRLWVQQPGFLAAHVDSAQTHIKNNYMRNPLPAEIFNEEICTLLKNKIRSTMRRSDDLTISFDYDGQVTAEDSQQILEKIGTLHSRVLKAREKATSEDRRDALGQFAATLDRAFYNFESDFFQQNVSRIVDDVVALIHSSLEIWPSLVEIVYYKKNSRALPMVQVKNKPRTNGKPAS